MKNIQIRTVHSGDLEECFEIETLCYHGHGATQERIEKRIEEYPEGFLVAVLGGRIVGFINSGCFHGDDISSETLKDLDGHDPSGQNAVIFSLVVHPDSQEKGIARKLLERFIADARQAGKRSILLVCRDYHLGFYAKFGFAYRAPSKLRFGGNSWYEMGLML